MDSVKYWGVGVGVSAWDEMQCWALAVAAWLIVSNNETSKHETLIVGRDFYFLRVQ